MKNIVILTKSLGLGGIEKVITEILKNVNIEKYRLFLFVENNLKEKTFFLDRVPKEVTIKFLVSDELNDKISKLKKEEKGILKSFKKKYLKTLERIEVENSVKKYIKEIEQEKGEIDSFIDFNYAAARRYIHKVKAKKKIAWIHSSLNKYLNGKNIKRYGKNLNKYDEIITICDEMKEEIKEMFPFLVKKIKRIYNPFDFEEIRKLSKDYSELSEEEFSLIKEKYILAASRLDLGSKDYKTLILGYKKAKERGLQENLFIIGSGRDREKIESLIEENGLIKNVKLLGVFKNPYVWMRNAQLFVHSSKMEGLPTVLIEAMICGTVVLSSDCPTGPKEILLKDKCGEIFKVGDDRGLNEKLVKLILNNEIESYYKQLNERIQEFSKEKIMIEIEGILNTNI